MTTPVQTRVIPGAFQLTLKLMQDGQPAAIVLGAKGPGTWTDTSGVLAWRDAAWNAFRMCVGDTTTCIGAVGRPLSAANLQPYEVGAPATPVGGQTGARAIAAATTLIKWTTATGGRSGRGRTFLPGLLAGHTGADGRTYASTYTATVNTAISNYLSNAGLASAGLTPAVLSFTRGQAYAITGGSLASVVGVQRRRMRA